MADERSSSRFVLELLRSQRELERLRFAQGVADLCHRLNNAANLVSMGAGHLQRLWPDVAALLAEQERGDLVRLAAIGQSLLDGMVEGVDRFDHEAHALRQRYPRAPSDTAEEGDLTVAVAVLEDLAQDSHVGIQVAAGAWQRSLVPHASMARLLLVEIAASAIERRALESRAADAVIGVMAETEGAYLRIRLSGTHGISIDPDALSRWQAGLAAAGGSWQGTADGDWVWLWPLSVSAEGDR